MKSKSKKPVVNMGKIKRELIKRDTGLDARFTTKVVGDKKKKGSVARKSKYPQDYLRDTDY